MHKVMAWLEVEARGVREFLGYTALAGLLVISLQEVVRAALTNWGIMAAPTGNPTSPFTYYGLMLMIDILLVAPIKEELMFRVVPLTVVIAFVTKRPEILFGTAIFFAALFGAIHPYQLYNKINIAIGGLIFGLVFLKCGGLQRKFIKASLATITAHGITNLCILLNAWWEYIVVKS